MAFGSLARAAGLGGKEALLELVFQPGRDQPSHLFASQFGRGFKGKAWLRGSRHRQQEQQCVLPLSRTFTNQLESTSGGGQRCYPHLAGGELLLILLLTLLSLLCCYQALQEQRDPFPSDLSAGKDAGAVTALVGDL